MITKIRLVLKLTQKYSSFLTFTLKLSHFEHKVYFKVVEVKVLC